MELTGVVRALIDEGLDVRLTTAGGLPDAGPRAEGVQAAGHAADPLGEAGRRECLRRFTISAWSERMSDVFHSVLQAA